jgi:hypothetical protein
VAGVAGTDMLLGTLSDLISTIRSRSSGEAHLFHVSTGRVVGSRQFDAASGVSATQSVTVANVGELKLPGALQASLSDLGFLDEDAFLNTREDGGGNELREADGAEYQLVWRFLWDGEYCLLSVTPNTEVQEPIESQLEAISAGVTTVLFTVILICVGMLVLIIPVVFFTAKKLSRPLIATCEQVRGLAPTTQTSALPNLPSGCPRQHPL